MTPIHDPIITFSNPKSIVSLHSCLAGWLVAAVVAALREKIVIIHEIVKYTALGSKMFDPFLNPK
jgi:hypothetical protein